MHHIESSQLKTNDGKSFVLNDDYAELGRDKSCEIVFPDITQFSMVSRRHAAIKRVEDGWRIVHLSTTNPTLVNEKVLTEPEDEMELHDGDVIRLSTHGPELRFVVVDEEEEEKKEATIQLDEEVQEGSSKKKPLKINRRVGLVAASLALIAIVIWSVCKLWPKDSEKPKDINTQLSESMASVYHVKAVSLSWSYEGRSETVDLEEDGWTGTGFCTSDGRFITSRHVVEPWFYASTEEMFWYNVIVSNGGNIKVTYEAKSQSRSFRFSLSDCQRDDSGDKVVSETTSRGYHYKYTEGGSEVYDYAWFYHDCDSGLVLDTVKDRCVDMGEILYVLGYPHGMQGDENTPLFSHAEAATKGLTDGVIVTTDTGFEHGNSGGPVMCEVDGVLRVVGIVTAGMGKSTGIVIPISVVK